VDAEGEKMSKSIGNVENLLDLTEQFDPRTYRMLLLQSHYRSPVRIVQDNLDASQKAVAGLDAFAARSRGVTSSHPDPGVLNRFRARMDDDFDTPGAMAVVFETVRQANAALDHGDPTAPALVAAVYSMLEAVGLTVGAGGDVPGDVAARASALDAARAAKDFATADALRAELQSEGWIVETTREGTTVRRT
jgi:cysteinyl-tRNA synthetase